MNIDWDRLLVAVIWTTASMAMVYLIAALLQLFMSLPVFVVVAVIFLTLVSAFYVTLD